LVDDRGDVTTFVREMAGQAIEFKTVLPGQFRILQRVQQATVKSLKKIQQDTKMSDEDKLVEAGKVVGNFDMAILTMVESLIVNRDDIDFLVDAQLRGEIEPQDMLQILVSPEESEEDDADPKPKPKKATANAKRSKK